MRKTADKIKIFSELFTGLTNVYGTYDPDTGRASQIKSQVSSRVLVDHLTGRKSYGVYLLDKDRTRAVALDFDTENRLPPFEFVNCAKHYGIYGYIERSKSKGHHVWIFFKKQGVPARKARLVVKHILDEIEESDVEVFPKQDALNTNVRYGNFINAPLFGGLVPKGRTLFVNPATFEPYPDQWGILESVNRHSEKILDDIIEMNDLSRQAEITSEQKTPQTGKTTSFCLPVCAQRMLQDGVSLFQRVSCFRLAVHLKRLGLPLDIIVTILKTWSHKNRPSSGKRVITDDEIIEQVSYAFSKSYKGYGCQSEAVKPFCDYDCPVYKQMRKKSA